MHMLTELSASHVPLTPLQGRIVQRLAQLYDELVVYAAAMGEHNKKLADYEVSSSVQEETLVGGCTTQGSVRT